MLKEGKFIVVFGIREVVSKPENRATIIIPVRRQSNPSIFMPHFIREGDSMNGNLWYRGSSFKA